jgi:hypothetical protein
MELSKQERDRRAEQSRRDRSYSLREWCGIRRISPSMFYKLRQQGLAPKVHYVGKKVLVSGEADAEWLAEREAEAERANGNSEEAAA